MELPVSTITRRVPGFDNRLAPARNPILGPEQLKRKDLLDQLSTELFVSREGWEAVCDDLRNEIESWQLDLRFQALATGDWELGDPHVSEEWWDL